MLQWFVVALAYGSHARRNGPRAGRRFHPPSQGRTAMEPFSAIDTVTSERLPGEPA